MNAESAFRPGVLHYAVLLLGAVALVCCGCSSLLQIPSNGVASRLTGFVNRDAKNEAKRNLVDDFETTLETPLLGDYISVQGNTLVPLRGV